MTAAVRVPVTETWDITHAQRREIEADVLAEVTAENVALHRELDVLDRRIEQVLDYCRRHECDTWTHTILDILDRPVQARTAAREVP